MSEALKNKKILITGASGSLGKQLLYELTSLGVKPIAHVRESSDTTYIDSLFLEKRVADMRIRPELLALVKGVDSVIHTAAWVDFRGDRLTQFAGVNTVGALELYNAARKAGVKRFVHVSTIAAVGAVLKEDSKESQHKTLVNENWHFNLDHLKVPYIMTKHAAEKELLNVASEAGDARGSGPELVIVNPSIIMAPSKSGDEYERVSKLFSLPFLPDHHRYVNLVDLRDVAIGTIAALEKGRKGERYILAGDNITVRDLILAISALVGKAPHLVKFPLGMLKIASHVVSAWTKFFGRSKLTLYPDLAKMANYDWSYSSRKARVEFGYSPRSIHISLNDLLTDNFTGSWKKG